MPNVLKQGPYRFFFYSNDRNEPAHVHVKRDRNVAKFWFDLVRLQRSGGFRRSEIRDIERIVRQYQILLIEEWNDYFND
ncbi:MAG: DUF4160 domain-containing protein [Caldilineaceae bacterium SB0666_bin_21]|nr:DUF4160 domain-containing protein [Caldilineaceae bacterium SB0666_bin_21]